MFSVLVIRLRSLRLLRVSGIVMRLRMFLLLITKDTRDYLAAAFPELNAWERAGADASSAGMVDAGFENQKELTKMQLDNQKEIAEMQNETQKEIAGIQSATSRQNTKDQVYAQNEMLAYQQK